MNRRQGLVGGSRPWWRNPGVGRTDRLDRTVRQPDQVEGLGKVPPGEAVRGLRDDGNGTLKTGILRGICLEINGERTQLFGDDVGDKILRRLAIERRIRNRKVAGSALEWLLEGLGLEGLGLEELLREALLLQGLRLEAEQKRHQIAEQTHELLQPYELLNVRRWRRQRKSLSDHPLLVQSLKVADDLRDDADQLAGDVSNILLCQLPRLLSPAARCAECRLELRYAELRPEVLGRIALAELTQAAEALLAEALSALHGRVLQLRLVLQHPDDLRYDREDLSHHFVDILLAQLPRRLAERGISDRGVRLLRLGQNLRQDRHQLPYHFTHILLRKLALLLSTPPGLLLLTEALLTEALGLPAPSRVISKGTDRRLTTVLAVLLAIRRLSWSVATLAGPGAIRLGGLRIERRPCLRIELRIVCLILLLGIEVCHRFSPCDG